MCLLLKNYLEQKSYEVVIANTLTNGMQELSVSYPDYIFLDNNLPDGRGWDNYEKILESQPQASIFLISAYRSSLGKEVANDRLKIIEKPLSIKVIDALISSN